MPEQNSADREPTREDAQPELTLDKEMLHDLVDAPDDANDVRGGGVGPISSANTRVISYTCYCGGPIVGQNQSTVSSP